MTEHIWTAYTLLPFAERIDTLKEVFASLSKQEQRQLENQAIALSKNGIRGIGIVSYLELILALYVYPGARAYWDDVLQKQSKAE